MPPFCTLHSILLILQGRVSSAAAAYLVQDENLQNSDLEPGKYEGVVAIKNEFTMPRLAHIWAFSACVVPHAGGFKLWECAVDLAQYLCKEYSLNKLITSKTDPNHELVGKRVLELGCGQGLSGIVPLLAGAEVHFQASSSRYLTWNSENLIALHHPLKRHVRLLHECAST